MFPAKLQAALEQYDRRKGLLRRLFGDAPAIAALRRLPEGEQNNYSALCQCFFNNMPPIGSASYQVWRLFVCCNSDTENSLILLHNQNILTPENAAVVLAHADPRGVAAALIALHHENLLTVETRALFLPNANPQHVRTALFTLHDANLLTTENATAILAYADPSSIVRVLPTLGALRDANLLTTENVTAILARVNLQHIAAALRILHEEKVLTQDIAIAVLAHASPQDIEDALRILHEAEILTQDIAIAVLANSNLYIVLQTLETLHDANALTAEKSATFLAHSNPYIVLQTLKTLRDANALTPENAAAVLAHENPYAVAEALRILRDANLVTAENVAAVLAHENPYAVAEALRILRDANLLTAENRAAVLAHVRPHDAANALVGLQTLHDNIRQELKKYHAKLEATKEAPTTSPITQKEATKAATTLLALINTFFELIEKYDTSEYGNLQIITDIMPYFTTTISHLSSKFMLEEERQEFYSNLYFNFIHCNLHIHHPEESLILFNCAPSDVRLAFYLMLSQDSVEENPSLQTSIWMTLKESIRDQEPNTKRTPYLPSAWLRLFEGINVTDNPSAVILACLNAYLTNSSGYAEPSAMMKTLFATLTKDDAEVLRKNYNTETKSFKSNLQGADVILAKLLAQWAVLLTCDLNVMRQFPELDKLFFEVAQSIPSEQDNRPVWKSVFGIGCAPFFADQLSPNPRDREKAAETHRFRR